MSAHQRPNSPCPECGYLLWQSDNFERIVRENMRLRRDLERAYAENGRLRAEAVVRDIDERERMGAVQSKVARQAKTLRQFEAKIRQLGAHPYAEYPEISA